MNGILAGTLWKIPLKIVEGTKFGMFAALNCLPFSKHDIVVIDVIGHCP